MSHGSELMFYKLRNNMDTHELQKHDNLNQHGIEPKRNTQNRKLSLSSTQNQARFRHIRLSIMAPKQKMLQQCNLQEDSHGCERYS